MKKKIFLVILLSIIIICSIAGIGFYIVKKDEIKKNFIGSNKTSTVIDGKDDKVITNAKTTIGTGRERPTDDKDLKKYSYISSDSIPESRKKGKDKLEYVIGNLKNKELKGKINSFIKESTTKLEQEKSAFKQYIEKCNRDKKAYVREEEIPYCTDCNEFNSGEYSGMTDIGKDTKGNIEMVTRWNCQNGYLSIAISYEYNYGDTFDNLVYDPYDDRPRNYGAYKSYCATYDLYSGKQLQFSDMFFKGEDYSTELYKIIQQTVTKHNMGNYIKREFDTLPSDYPYFTIDSIIFNKDNLYFSEGKTISQDDGNIFSITNVYRDMKGIFNSNIEIGNTEIEEDENTLYGMGVGKSIAGKYIYFDKVPHKDKNLEEKINTNIEKYVEYLCHHKYINQPVRIAYKKDFNNDSGDYISIGSRCDDEGGFLEYINIYINFSNGKLEKLEYSLEDELGGDDQYTSGNTIYDIGEFFNIKEDEIKKLKEQIEQKYNLEELKWPDEPEDTGDKEKMKEYEKAREDYDKKIEQYSQEIKQYLINYLKQKGLLQDLNKAYEELKNI